MCDRQFAGAQDEGVHRGSVVRGGGFGWGGKGWERQRCQLREGEAVLLPFPILLSRAQSTRALAGSTLPICVGRINRK